MTVEPMRLDDAERYLGQVIVALHAMAPERKGPVVAVLDFLLGHIRRTRTDLNSLRADSGEEPCFSSAVDELEEIVGETAAATNTIMDAAEAIERIASGLSPDIAGQLRAQATRIYEASAFQDITGQRIAKAMRSLQQLERQIDVLAQGCTGEGLALDCEVAPPETLTNGPQLSGNALSQDDIDKLLAGLG